MEHLSTIDYAMMGIGAFLLLVWLIIFVLGLRYNRYFEALEEKEFPLKELYGMGYVILEKIGYRYKSKGDRVLRQQLEVLYGEKYCEYYLRVIHAQQLTAAMLLTVVAFAMYGLTLDMLSVVIVLMFAGLSYYYFGTATRKKILKRSEELLHDFSEVVAKLALLTNAGMIMREAWQQVATGGRGVIYHEMQQAMDAMNNGAAEIDAIYGFGSRCMLPEIKKFTTTIIQGMEKGNKELVDMLQLQSKEVWQLKKQLVRREGEKAASKLLIPISIMFIGVLIMILVPIFTNLGVS